VCHQQYEYVDDSDEVASYSTTVGAFGIANQTVRLSDGRVLHSCPRLPELVQANRTVRQELLVRGLQGPVDPLAVVASARLRLDSEAHRLLALGLAADALAAGLAVAGEAEGTGFQEWQIPPSEAIARLAATWPPVTGPRSGSDGPERLMLTEEGRESAEEILRQEAAASES